MNEKQTEREKPKSNNPLSHDELNELLKLKNREIVELERLVAMYQSEGEDEILEESEYRSLVAIPQQKRTELQHERLRFLSVLIVDLCVAANLRKLIKLAWYADRKACPVCKVTLTLDLFHLPTCALGIIIER